MGVRARPAFADTDDLVIHATHAAAPATGVGLGVGLLLLTQLQHIASTSEHCTMGPDGRVVHLHAGETPRARFAGRLRDVMGGGSVPQWLWPTWGLPVSTRKALAALAVAKKEQ